MVISPTVVWWGCSMFDQLMIFGDVASVAGEGRVGRGKVHRWMRSLVVVGPRGLHMANYFKISQLHIADAFYYCILNYVQKTVKFPRIFKLNQLEFVNIPLRDLDSFHRKNWFWIYHSGRFGGPMCTWMKQTRSVYSICPSKTKHTEIPLKFIWNH